MELKEFLVLAKRHTYAAGVKPEILPDGGKRFRFEAEDLVYQDTYYGYSPFAGQEIVFRKFPNNRQTAVWHMNYSGACLDEDVHMITAIFLFLKSALVNTTESRLFRGPTIFENEAFCYRSEFMSHSLDFFSGKEDIFLAGELAYTGSFSGGLLRTKEVLDFGSATPLG